MASSKIQRVPQGLLNLLGIYGGETPTQLDELVRGSVDLTQLYANQQLRFLQENNAAVAVNGTLSALLNNPDIGARWAVLHSACAIAQKTATVTALRVAVQLARQSGNFTPIASQELGPYGATVAGSADVPFFAPFPVLLQPPWDLRASVRNLGTDATVNITIQALIGVLA